jgi:hypothetical protein
VAAVLGPLGCTAPTRHLTVRQVEDPIVHPRGLASFSMSGGVMPFASNNTRDSAWLNATFRYGFTDRLELNNATLRYAFLDDAPAPAGAPDGRRHGPLALAAQAGLRGFGVSSIEGLIILPMLSLEARKHLGSRVYLWSELSWSAWWASSARARAYPYNEGLWPTGSSSRAVLSLGGVVQLVDRVALSLGGHADQLRGCVFPSCDVTSRALIGFTGIWIRPLRWMDVSVFGTVGRRDRVAPPVVPAPGEPLDLPPNRITWLSVSMALTFRW